MPVVSVCGSPTINVGFMVTDPFNAGNVFTMELSDETGSFTTPTVIGSWNGTTSGSFLCTFPAGIMGGSGVAIRVVATDPQEVGVPYELPITTSVPANAGGSGSVSVCSNGLPFELVDFLFGNPDQGGSWVGPSTILAGTYDPMSMVLGTYTYTVPGTGSCADASAFISVTEVVAPNAGFSSTDTVCITDPPFLLLGRLGGTPNAGGVWQSPAGSPHPGIFAPEFDPPGCYSYTVAGSAPCTNATAELCIVVQIDDCISTGLNDAELTANSDLHIISGWNTDQPVLALPQSLSGEGSLVILDAMGRELSVRP